MVLLLVTINFGNKLNRYYTTYYINFLVNIHKTTIIECILLLYSFQIWNANDDTT